MVEKIIDDSPTISHTSIIALRNLAVDLKNKELIGKYGMREVCSHIPDAKQVKNNFEIKYQKNIIDVEFYVKKTFLGSLRRKNCTGFFISRENFDRISLRKC